MPFSPAYFLTLFKLEPDAVGVALDQDARMVECSWGIGGIVC